jgi:hypothetical protein
MGWFYEHDDIMNVTGIDLSMKALEANPFNTIYAEQWDLEEKPFSCGNPHLVWCAEVVEHVDAKALHNLMETLTQGKVACITHARPGQGGHHHCNEQPASYWIDQFKRYGWELDRKATAESKTIAKQDCTDWVNFWSQSGLIFRPKTDEPSLVMTLSSGYDWPTIRPFIESLNRSGYVGDVVVFYNRTSDETLLELDRQGVTCIPCHAQEPYLPLVEYEVATGHQFNEMHPVNYRFAAYRSYLKTARTEYGMVMLADARDIWFKGNFCEGLTFEKGLLHLFAEYDKTLGSCPYNRKWLQGIVDAETVEAMKDRPIYCAGVIIGDAANIIDLCEQLLVYFSMVQPAPDRKGVDQAALQYMIYAGTIDANLYPCGEGPVHHVGYYPRDKPEHSTAAVVHQYDRFQALTDEYKAIQDKW